MNQKNSVRFWVKACIAAGFVCTAFLSLKPSYHEYTIERRYKQAISIGQPDASLLVALRGYDPPEYALNVLWNLAFDGTSNELEIFTAKRYLAGTAWGRNPLVFPGEYEDDDWNLAFEKFLSKKESSLAALSKEEAAFVSELRRLSQEK